jgi:hypothetical protein
MDVSLPLTPTLSPNRGGEGRVRGLMRVKTNMGPLIIPLMRRKRYLMGTNPKVDSVLHVIKGAPQQMTGATETLARSPWSLTETWGQIRTRSRKMECEVDGRIRNRVVFENMNYDVKKGGKPGQ